MQRPRPEKVTLADVAARAGVSPATVSKVLNGRSDVSPSTRAYVLNVIEQVGYRGTTPRHERRRNRALVTVLDFVASRYAGTVLQSILDTATEADAELLLRLPPGEKIANSRTSARTWVAQQQAAGAIGVIGLAVTVPDPIIDAARDLALPVVAIDPIDTTDSRVVSIGATNWAGGRSATDHLIELGHKRIAWIGGPLSSAPSAERFHGLRAALDAAGLPADPDLVRHGAFEVESGRLHARELLSLAAPPTAIVAGNDEIAIGVLAAAAELDVGVPAALSVTGFDDTPQTEWMTPRLTSVRQPLAGMGRIAVETVLAMAEGTAPVSRHLQLATALSIRDSTGPVLITKGAIR
ncbi:LacI family DNA-binding transcriptional regulator [Glycomyces sambucus]|uniref:LacI family DNA-binding transcriptional regulator n=1 Tax=Glycomyces sambucus TaxID=380244 RepID=UPI001C40AFC3|nr:LacI family DNA-binding transcriptional regulator [Glycomyces sambucus]